MLKTSPAAPDIDAYIKAFPPDVRAILRTIRATVRTAAPDAAERISYRMPAFQGSSGSRVGDVGSF